MTQIPVQSSASGNSGERRSPFRPTAVLVLADGQAFYGRGFGAPGEKVGELCFNTAMTGYQEVMTDPSYAEQIVAFTFPHVGNVGANPEDDESVDPAALGMVVKLDPTEPSSWRALETLDGWLAKRGRIGVAGIDTRRLTRLIRDQGMPHAVIAHDPEGNFDVAALAAKAKAWKGLVGADLAKQVTCAQSYKWSEARWIWPEGHVPGPKPRFRVTAIDYGAKRNILRCLAEIGADVTVLPATADLEQVLSQKPDGVFLSNGPGDPAATGAYAVPMIQGVMARGIPIFGVCLGHQMLALALGAKTKKMKQGHHGANHPVQEHSTGKVEIVSMNHGFTVDAENLPEGVKETHVSLFDGTNCGVSAKDGLFFSVQHHPEASPGPRDSFYLFERFARNMDERRA